MYLYQIGIILQITLVHEVGLFYNGLPCMYVFTLHLSFYSQWRKHKHLWEIFSGVGVQSVLENNPTRKVKKHSSEWSSDSGG